MGNPSQIEITIPSDTTEGHAVQEKILSLLAEDSFPDKDLFGIKLALEEAIVNAIKHGNQMDPSKNVTIGCQLHVDRVRITIEDEGEGFQPEDVPDPTDDDNLEKPSGRGLMLIKAFMNVVEFNERGNRLTMEKERSSED